LTGKKVQLTISIDEEYYKRLKATHDTTGIPVARLIELHRRGYSVVCAVCEKLHHPPCGDDC